MGAGVGLASIGLEQEIGGETKSDPDAGPYGDAEDDVVEGGTERCPERGPKSHAERETQHKIGGLAVGHHGLLGFWPGSLHMPTRPIHTTLPPVPHRLFGEAVEFAAGGHGNNRDPREPADS